jgi:hypothetical protein
MSTAPNSATPAGEVKRSLPGWSAPAHGRKETKPAYDCPEPTIEDYEEYRAWKIKQDKLEELPTAPQVFLSDTDLLYHQDTDVNLPWVHRLRCEIPMRAGLLGELPCCAAFIGYGLENEDAAYAGFVDRMEQIGIRNVRRVRAPPTRFEIAHLEQSDVVFLQSTDYRECVTLLEKHHVDEQVKWRYWSGALTIFVGAAVMVAGKKGWWPLSSVRPEADAEAIIPQTGFKIFPHHVSLDPCPGPKDLEEVCNEFGPATVIVGLPPATGFILNRDGLLEPLRHMINEYRYDFRTNSVKRAILLPPPRSTSLIVPLSMHRAQKSEDTEEVFHFSLTKEEETEEEDLLLRYWPKQPAKEVVASLEALKAEGNAALKAGDAPRAAVLYERALHELQAAESRDDGEGVLDLHCALLLNACAARLALAKKGPDDSSPQGTGEGGLAIMLPVDDSAEASATLTQRSA